MLTFILLILFFALSIGIIGFLSSLHKPQSVKVLSKKKQKRAQRALYFKQKLRLPKLVGELNPLNEFFFSPYGFGILLLILIVVIPTTLLTQESSYYDHISGRIFTGSLFVLLAFVFTVSYYQAFRSRSRSSTPQLAVNQPVTPPLFSKQGLTRGLILLGCFIILLFSCRSISQDITSVAQGPQYSSGTLSELSFSSSRRSASRIVTIANHKYRTLNKVWFNQLQTQKGQKIDYIHDPSHKFIYPIHDPRLSSIALSLVIVHSIIWLCILGFAIYGYLFLFLKEQFIHWQP